MKRSLLPAIVALVAFFAACQQPPAKAPTYSPVTREHAGYCVQTCRNLGMQMTAMVVIMSSTGCVCQPASASSATTSGAAAASSGAAIASATAAAVSAEEQRRRAAAARQQ